jgi:hypothetical protein
MVKMYKMHTFTEKQQKAADWLLTRFSNQAVQQFHVVSSHTIMTGRHTSNSDKQVCFTAIDGHNSMTSLDKWDQYITSGDQINGYTPIYLTLIEVIKILNAHPSNNRKYVMVDKVIKLCTAIEGSTISTRTLVYCFNLGDGSPKDNADLHQAVTGAIKHYFMGQEFDFMDAVCPILTDQDKRLWKLVNAFNDIGIPKACSVIIKYDKKSKFVIVPEEREDNYACKIGKNGFAIYMSRIDVLLGIIREKSCLNGTVPHETCFNNAWIEDMFQYLWERRSNRLMFGHNKSDQEIKILIKVSLAVYISIMT